MVAFGKKKWHRWYSSQKKTRYRDVVERERREIISYHIISWHITSRLWFAFGEEPWKRWFVYIIPHHVMPYQILPYHIISYHIPAIVCFGGKKRENDGWCWWKARQTMVGLLRKSYNHEKNCGWSKKNAWYHTKPKGRLLVGGTCTCPGRPLSATSPRRGPMVSLIDRLSHAANIAEEESRLGEGCDRARPLICHITSHPVHFFVKCHHVTRARKALRKAGEEAGEGGGG